MYSLEEVNESLENDSVSEALYKMHRFAQSQGLVELERWTHLELDGYVDRTDDEEKSANHRSLAVGWLTIHNRPVHLDETFGFLQTIHLWNSVSKLEDHTEDDGLYCPPGLIAHLNQYATVPIKGARITPAMMKGLLNRVRLEARKRIHDSLPRVPDRKVMYAAPNFAALVSDADLVRILGRRWIEANLCFEAGAYLSTLIMLGSIMEGTLLAKAQQNPADANRATASPKDKATGVVLHFKQWSLQD